MASSVPTLAERMVEELNQSGYISAVLEDGTDVCSEVAILEAALRLAAKADGLGGCCPLEACGWNGDDSGRPTEGPLSSAWCEPDEPGFCVCEQRDANRTSADCWVEYWLLEARRAAAAEHAPQPQAAK